MSRATKKRALETDKSTVEKSKKIDIDAMQGLHATYDDWYDMSETKKARTVITSKGRRLVELRKFADGKSTESAIFLNEEEIKDMISLLPTIENYYEAALYMDEDVDFKHDLGHNKFVTVSSDYLCVDVRMFFKFRDGTELRATKRGVSFNINEFYKLKEFLLLFENTLQLSEFFKLNDVD
jgi:hypothetical protein